MPSNQKKIRDLKRVLRRKTSVGGTEPSDTVTADIELPVPLAAAAAAQEGILRKIVELQSAREDVKRNMRIRRNAVKYHMVKFLERKKVTRMIRSVDGKLRRLHRGEEEPLMEGEEYSLQLVQRREQLLENLAYVMYYPKEMKYVSLFPSQKGDDNDFEGSSTCGSDRSAVTSAKARSIALQEWRDHLCTTSATDNNYLSTADAADIDKGDANSDMDKVTYAMKVEYFGGSSLGNSMMKEHEDDDLDAGVGDDATMKRNRAVVVVDSSIKNKGSSSSCSRGTSGRTTSEAAVEDEGPADDFFVADGDARDGDVRGTTSRDNVDPINPRGHRSQGKRPQSRNDTRHASTKRKFEQHMKTAKNQHRAKDTKAL